MNGRHPPRNVLVTGASSGIGKAIAEELARAGMNVFAGVRRLSRGQAEPRVQEILLDVTVPESIAAAVVEIAGGTGDGEFDALVNNAGIGTISPVEFTSAAEMRRIFDVNVFGLLEVTRAFLPLLHKSGGSIVNIGSIGGMITMPFGAALCASKHSVEAVSDALRMELKASGIRVSLIQPASINSGAAEKLAAQTDATVNALPPEGRERYGTLLTGFSKKMLSDETAGSPPGVVAAAVLENLLNPSPPARRLVGKHALLLWFLALHVPASLRERILRHIFLKQPMQTAIDR